MVILALADYHRRRLRISNPIECGIQKELKRRTRKVRVFPNTETLNPLASAVLVKIDEKWVAAKK
jgi:transposase-like protein